MGRWQQQARTRQTANAGSRASSNRLACIGFAIIAGLVTYAFSFKWRESHDFHVHAVATQATLANDYVETQRRRKDMTTTSYRVSYAYTTPAGSYSGTGTISDPPSPTMTVYYHSLRPAVSKLEYLENYHFDCGVLIGMALACIASLGMAWVFHRKVKRVTEAVASEDASRSQRDG